MFVHSRQGAVDVIEGDRPLGRDELAEPAALLDKCLASGQPRIVLDLKKVPLIDSAGLELLLDSSDRCRRRGGGIRLAEPNPLCREILRITGVAERIEVYPNCLSAVGSFAQ
jgi:anti-anti-sigma factor